MRSTPLICKQQLQHLVAAPINVKFVADGSLIEGYGSVFNVVDSYGDIVDPGAFTKTLQDHSSAGTKPAMLAWHRMDKPIGAWERIEQDRRGLKVSGRLNLDTQDGREVSALIQQKAIDGLSIGFRVPTGGFARGSDGKRHIREIELVEISIVSIPANGQARIAGARQADTVISRRDFETFLLDAGFARAAARKLSGGGWPALSNNHDHEAAADLLRAVKSATDELKGSSK